MKNFLSFFVSVLLVFAFVFNALPCGPSYLQPLFDYKSAPENPFENFAAGRIGIVKPTYNRTVLFAAYRYLNGGGFTPEEQKALVEVWHADFNNQPFETTDTEEAIKKWIEKRKSVLVKEEKLPEIYSERNYGGYDFFPNCTVSAFETATATLSDRVVSYGAENKDVKDWVAAQDKVFSNCSSGKQTPDEANVSMPEWLQKDRAYQLAAADFYSLNYESAKNRFADIAQDATSPWQDTADYLVARTLIRQASLSKTEDKANRYYTEAEQKLVNLTSNKFADSAERLHGLVKFRLHPQERVRELAQKLTNVSGNQNLRQDVIDYSWLLDKFEKETLETEEKRKEAEKPKDPSATPPANTSPTNNNNASGEDQLSIYFYSDDYTQNWTIYVKPDATDAEALAEAEKVAGRPLSEAMKKVVRDGRQNAYQNRYSSGRKDDYPGRYYGEEKISLSLLPDFMRYEDLTDWLFTYQTGGNESYLYALSKYRQTNADIWLMAAISKADKTSSGLPALLEGAGKTDRSALAFPTVSYHTARILIEQGKTAEARKMIDEVLAAPDNLPISSINQFLELRLRLAETLDDFIRYSLRKPFGFDVDGSTGSIDEIIAEQKKTYNPEYTDKSREEYEREVDEIYADEKKWQDRLMFDAATLELFNRHFPASALAEAEKSAALPDYLREHFAMAVWTRALVFEDYAAAAKIAPEIIKYKPEMEAPVNEILTAKTPVQKQTAALFYMLKNPIITPYIEDAFTKTDNETGSFDSNDWWCAPYFPEDGDRETSAPESPKFLTAEQKKQAQSERQRLKDFGDASGFLSTKVLEWAQRAPKDPRIPESLFIAYEANGWKKYACGGDEDMRQQIAEFLKARYPQSEWTMKLEQESEQ